jgi:demethylmenaquinone methyltransferase/2-methoxy-6-polyprenyl-1,4-benzoquinol methylase
LIKPGAENLLNCRETSEGKKVLDLCCGTGDLSRQLRKSGGDVTSLDFSLEMLKRGRQTQWLTDAVTAADASNLPFKNNSFRLLTIAFGIRNIPDIAVFLKEACRVTEKNGILQVLELTRPSGKLVGLFYKFYLKVLLPLVGGLISGNRSAYKYLAGTIETFIDPNEIAALMREAGYSEVTLTRKSFGIATIITAVK